MISKMNKLTMLVYHKEYEDFLVKLRDAGVVHITEKNSGALDTPELQSLFAQRSRCEKLIKKLETFATENETVADSSKNAELMMEKCEELLKNQEQLQQDKLNVEKDVATMSIWGNFDKAIFSKLADAGYELRFYQVSENGFSPEWYELYNAIIINKAGAKCYFVTVTP